MILCSHSDGEIYFSKALPMSFGPNRFENTINLAPITLDNLILHVHRASEFDLINVMHRELHHLKGQYPHRIIQSPSTCPDFFIFIFQKISTSSLVRKCPRFPILPFRPCVIVEKMQQISFSSLESSFLVAIFWASCCNYVEMEFHLFFLCPISARARL